MSLRRFFVPSRRHSLIRTTLGLVLGWTATSILVGAVLTAVTIPPQPLDFETQVRFVVSASVVFGVVLGLASAWFELVALPRDGAGLRPGWVIVLRTLFYIIVCTLAMVIAALRSQVRILGRAPSEVLRSAEFWGFFESASFLFALSTFVVAAFYINFTRQVRLMLGPGTLAALLVGRYRLPVPEQRAFMFLDLTGSTGLAQRLGPSRFNAFKNDYFRDVVEPILATGGQIYQYVGDEVVVTWKLRADGTLAKSPVETFLRLDEVVERRTPRYLERYGEAPQYKAGLHVGDVVTAEIGEMKKDIVHSGDAVNVTARIEGKCHALGARLLASEAALALAPLPDGLEATEVGAIDLRGRDGAVKLFRVLEDPAFAEAA